MKPFRPLTATEQFAVHLRDLIESGALAGQMPGVHKLAKELGVSPKTVVAAVAQLEHEGLIQNQGARRRCRILPQTAKKSSGLRIGLLPYERQDRLLPELNDMKHSLEAAGHDPFFTASALCDIGMNLNKIARFVGKNDADAWVVSSGSNEVLHWFAEKSTPAFAEFGRFTGVPIAGMGVRKIPAMTTAVRRLVELGHRRIVLIVREERRKPKPALFEQAFLDELESHGIATGAYHLPEWKNSVADFHRCLDSLIEVTPPTAFFVCEAPLFAALQQHLALRGFVAPRDVSLICDDPDRTFEWCDPPITHIRWDHRPIVNRIVRWANRIARGIDDRRQSFTIAEFAEGGTIGPAPDR